MKKRMISLALVAMLCLSLLVGCVLEPAPTEPTGQTQQAESAAPETRVSVEPTENETEVTELANELETEPATEPATEAPAVPSETEPAETEPEEIQEKESEDDSVPDNQTPIL